MSVYAHLYSLIGMLAAQEHRFSVISAHKKISVLLEAKTVLNVLITSVPG